MATITKSLTTQDKLSILSQDSQYDLACACGTSDNDRRSRSEEGKWLYPVSLPNGGSSVLFKTLISNVCVNDCAYCPLRVGMDQQRCVIDPEVIASVFLDYFRRKKVFGLFISSGVTGSPDASMERINRVAAILRMKERFRGYIHLKVIPGASDAAVEESVSLANAVSINMETAGEDNFNRLCRRKNYHDDVIRPLKLISSLTAKGERYSRVKQTTQFVVGASNETDRELVNYSEGLYKKLGLQRIYFSAYQRGVGEADLPGEHSPLSNSELLTREHRLYQVDWLLRKYGFSAGEVPLGRDGNLSLTVDPKEAWAQLHPEFFPVNMNRASKWDLLRVPGLGPVMVNRIIKQRQNGRKIRRMSELGRMNKRLEKAGKYIKYS
jgi:predicted DNA-binding helix-hairpin-helix protein